MFAHGMDRLANLVEDHRPPPVMFVVSGRLGGVRFGIHDATSIMGHFTLKLTRFEQNSPSRVSPSLARVNVNQSKAGERMEVSQL
jgi:hypothetical protein